MLMKGRMYPGLSTGLDFITVHYIIKHYNILQFQMMVTKGRMEVEGSLALVSQQAWIFNGTLRNSIRHIIRLSNLVLFTYTVHLCPKKHSLSVFFSFKICRGFLYTLCIQNGGRQIREISLTSTLSG